MCLCSTTVKTEEEIDSKEEQTELDNDTDEEDTDDENLDDKRERHWRMVFQDNGGWVEDAKALLHAKRWDIYVNEREKIVKGGYLVEVAGHDKKKVLWEVIDDHFV